MSRRRNFRCDFCHWPSRRRHSVLTASWLLMGHRRCMYSASTLMAMPERATIVLEDIANG